MACEARCRPRLALAFAEELATRPWTGRVATASFPRDASPFLVSTEVAREQAQPPLSKLSSACYRAMSLEPIHAGVEDAVGPVAQMPPAPREDLADLDFEVAGTGVQRKGGATPGVA